MITIQSQIVKNQKLLKQVDCSSQRAVFPLCHLEVLRESGERAFPFLGLVPQEYARLTHISKGTASQCLSVGEMGM